MPRGGALGSERSAVTGAETCAVAGEPPATVVRGFAVDAGGAEGLAGPDWRTSGSEQPTLGC